MPTASRKRKQREERKKVSARKWAEKPDSGGFQSRCFKVPDDKRVWIVGKEGVRRIDIIPYVVPKGAHNPNALAGEIHFERTFWDHVNIGAEGDRYPCLKKTFKQRCPICDFRTGMLKEEDADEKLVKSLAPKERQLWNVFDHDEPERGVQLWEYSFHLFGKQLKARINNSDEEDGYEFFSDPEEGMTLKVGFGEDSFGGKPFYTAASIDFKPRRQGLDDELLEQAMVLDELLIQYEYDQLKKIFMETADDSDDDIREEEEEEKPRKRSSAKKQPKEEEVDEDDWNDEEEEPTKQTKKSASAAKKSSSAKQTKSSATTKTASPSKIEVDMEVEHEKHGDCVVVKVSKSGNQVQIQDEDGEKYLVKANELTKIEYEDDEDEDEDVQGGDDDDEWDDEDWDDDE